jgi:misacylated tRNA(Ala) deacylase
MSTRALFREDAYLTRCEASITAIDELGIHLDQTVSYPLGGGQAGDAGSLTLADGTRIEIADTRKAKFEGATPDDAVHVPAPDQEALFAKLQVGDRVTAEIDWERRYRHMRLHTATHLLCAALPYPVDGCSITSGYARMDFATVEPIEREALEIRLRELIGGAHPVATEWITDQGNGRASRACAHDEREATGRHGACAFAAHSRVSTCSRAAVHMFAIRARSVSCESRRWRRKAHARGVS